MILVTGAAGYIGSHTCVALVESGYDIVAIDNFANSKPEALRRVAEITGKAFPVHSVDMLDAQALDEVFRAYAFQAVIHFAGLKAVGESVAQPLRYYRNNLGSTLNLLESMLQHGVKKIVFSSSATVYGASNEMPLKEDMPIAPVNPYGQTKAMIEQILRDVAVATEGFGAALLRYFNPVGAHPSGRIGEDPQGIPNNLVPYVAQVAVGKRPEVVVFGGDYLTPDGTGVRDYIHVMDLASGHVRALDWVLSHAGAEAFNLGTGKGSSVLEVIRAFERASGRKIPYRIGPRRPGDAAVSYADPSKAEHVLGWKATQDLDAMCRDTWRWQSQNPNGYDPA
ncbi:UDP-glucose 4-epimerase GalE [Alicyclobacillus acidocaldarius]|uniref:UDP-glucose 4-epimerase n=1 Tax=Alicyclobacillus acidocaldarius subsp. acidocaldarius (strain ATCC 27009 / DSM 446 / BCRC 14685 / JCM 5260 / KCTC 1825 / NBRC 15652 / NCIMB 11725 / NRRL B-14509 / 104-IA) TaxID=521098 RepID=C8WWV3_ALIAD|nr:UDP-glucose 4-epimerase GalE [Alicyclobacillus acidocaldarius]ACV58575.1 UDP-glucose 4-epimerase [Alicyclobacillus acidocaldarius subsp. acidocaldarius DSM 446]